MWFSVSLSVNTPLVGLKTACFTCCLDKPLYQDPISWSDVIMGNIAFFSHVQETESDSREEETFYSGGTNFHK